MILDILKEAAFGSFNSVLGIAKIVIPLMVLMQLGRDYDVLDKVSKYFKPITDFFGMSKDSSFPLLVGVFFGISYGAGIIIQCAKDGSLSKKDLFLLVMFLIACHAVFEDTLLFVAIGANGWIVLMGRILAASLLTYLMSKRLKNSIYETLQEKEKPAKSL